MLKQISVWVPPHNILYPCLNLTSINLTHLVDKNNEIISTLKPYRLQQLEDRQLATKRYQSRSKEVDFWLDNMETKLGTLDLTVQEAKAVDIQIQQLRVSNSSRNGIVYCWFLELLDCFNPI